MIGLKDAPAVIMTLVLIGFVGGASLIALSQFSTSVQVTASTTVSEEEMTMSNSTVQYVDVTTTADLYNGGLAVAGIRNSSGTTTLASTNYTVDATSGTVILNAGDFETHRWNGVDVVVNYTYNANTNPASYLAIRNVSSASGNVMSNMTTVGTLIGVALLVGVVLVAFGAYGGRRRQ